MSVKNQEVLRIFFLFLGITTFSAIMTIPLVLFEQDTVKINDGNIFNKLNISEKEKLSIGDTIGIETVHCRMYSINKNSKLFGYVMFSTFDSMNNGVSFVAMYDKNSTIMNVTVINSANIRNSGFLSFKKSSTDKLIGLGGLSSFPLKVSLLPKEKIDSFSGATESWEELFFALNYGQKKILALKGK